MHVTHFDKDFFFTLWAYYVNDLDILNLYVLANVAFSRENSHWPFLLADERDYKAKASPKEILNMLENLTKQMDGKARMRYGFF